MRRLAALAAVMALVWVVVGSTPANARADNDMINLYAGTYYNAPWFARYPVGTCYSLGGSTMDNQASSVFNWSNYTVRLYTTYNCSGGALIMGPNEGFPVLTSESLNNAISSFRRTCETPC